MKNVTNIPLKERLKNYTGDYKAEAWDTGKPVGRQDWNEAFAKMSEAREDKLLLPEDIDSETFEWVW